MMHNHIPPPPSARPQLARPRLERSSIRRSVRETIESIAIAFALAFLFKTFEAEAFVIPTGSMAPTLMGRHKDVDLPRVRLSLFGQRQRRGRSQRRASKARPAARRSSVAPARSAAFRCRSIRIDDTTPAGTANPSYSGDRIWVSKVPYHLMEPRRWDVIVFRFPEEAETYYIKRLVGLPNETVKILHGDIYTKGPDDADFVIQRKPPDKVRAMAQVVHDNDYVSPELLEHGWPLRWQPWSEQDAAGRLAGLGGHAHLPDRRHRGRRDLDALSAPRASATPTGTTRALAARRGRPGRS